jgi:hypothetical protein
MDTNESLKSTEAHLGREGSGTRLAGSRKLIGNQILHRGGEEAS